MKKVAYLSPDHCNAIEYDRSKVKAHPEAQIMDLDEFQSAFNGDELSDLGLIIFFDEEDYAEDRRAQLMDTEIWKTRMCFEDVYSNMDEDDEQPIIDAMSDDELEKFINDNLHLMEKGFDGGMMSDWSTVASTIASELDYPEADDETKGW